MTPGTSFETAWGTVELTRYPARERELLLPFDGADRLLLQHLADSDGPARQILVVGDRHGALTTALAGHAQVDLLVDSYLSLTAAEQNLAANNRTARLRPRTPAERYDAVVIRPGKSADLLRTLLSRARPGIGERTTVLAADMVKHLQRWVSGVLEEQVGPTRAGLARFKARVLTATASPGAPGPVPDAGRVEVPGTGVLHTAPGTFAASGLDLGTRALLAHLPSGLGTASVADLGCGNGVLGIVCARRNPGVRMLMVDESYSAIECAAANWRRLFGERPAEIVVGDGLTGVPAGSLDVVVCNPPFHLGHVVEPWIAHRLLDQAARALRPGGRLYLVGNRHLDHGLYLRRSFARVERLADDPKFTVLCAQR